MVELTEKDYAKFKALCDKHGIKYTSEMEYRESANNLVSLVKLLYEMGEEHRMWDERLKDEPKGFAIPSEGRSCCLCRETVYGQVWYDKWGMKCMNCQDAFNKRIIPGVKLPFSRTPTVNSSVVS